MTIRQLLRILQRRKLAGKPQPLYERFFLLPEVVTVYGSVRILSIRVGENHQVEAFVKLAEESLALIERIDPAAYRMVEREICYLMDTYLPSVGQYHRSSRVCKINFKHFRVDPTLPEYEWWIAIFACTIVHEAMHGRLFSMGIPYNKQTRERIERLCVLREQQFANRWKSDNYDSATLVTPFDASHWQPSWNRNALYHKHRKKEMSAFLTDLGVAPWWEPLVKMLGNTHD